MDGGGQRKGGNTNCCVSSILQEYVQQHYEKQCFPSEARPTIAESRRPKMDGKFLTGRLGSSTWLRLFWSDE